MKKLAVHVAESFLKGNTTRHENKIKTLYEMFRRAVFMNIGPLTHIDDAVCTHLPLI